MKFKGIIVFDSITMDKYSSEAENIKVFNSDSQSTRSILAGLENNFDMEEIAFINPISLFTDSPLFHFNGERFYPISGEVNTENLVILSVNAVLENYSIGDLHKQYTHYTNLGKKNKIDRFINPLESKFKISKNNLYNIIDNSLLPNRFEFNSWEDISRLLVKEEQLVMKHELGGNGDQVYLINLETLPKIKSDLEGKKLSEYVLQEYVEIISDKRLIIFGDKLVASRVITDRVTPWESRGYGPTRERKYILESYDPSQTEIKDALKFHKQCGLDYSAVDFIECDDGRNLLMEINASHPGMVMKSKFSPVSLYDLGETFAKYLNEEFSKC
jgi:hypothetical protein